MPVPVISFRSVVALVDRFPVLAGADLTVERGQSVLVTGPNGAGKTSLLRAVAALLPIASGEASVLGLDVDRDRREIRRRVGYLSHTSPLYAELTVRENIDFAVRASGSDRRNAAEAMDALGLRGRLADVPVQRVSAGQRRRTALAALVARRPELWLLDEPHTGLDADTRVILDELITNAVNTGATVLFSSHEQHPFELATHTIHVEGGQVTSVGRVNIVDADTTTKAVADVS